MTLAPLLDVYFNRIRTLCSDNEKRNHQKFCSNFVAYPQLLDICTLSITFLNTSCNFYRLSFVFELSFVISSLRLISVQTALCALAEIVSMRFVNGVGPRPGVMGIDYPTACWLYKYVNSMANVESCISITS